MCLLSDALLQHLPSYLGFSYLGRGVSLHGCSSKAQPLLLTLDEGYLLTAARPDLQRGIAPLGPLAPAQPRLLGRRVGLPDIYIYTHTHIHIYVCVCVCVYLRFSYKTLNTDIIKDSWEMYGFEDNL